MKLNTITAGDGPRSVGLVHGLGASAATWEPLVDRLVATGRYTVTAVDLRGHGHSARADTYRLEDFADDVVEALPAGLHGVVGHSLGGAVLVRAVERLQPAHALYLDPGFQLALPTSGLAGRLFWTVPILSMGVAGAAQARRGAKLRAGYAPGIRDLMDDARTRFDGKMAIGVFRDVAFHPLASTPPAVPSTVILSDDSAAVLPDRLAADLATAGWSIRRLSGLHHDMHLEDPERTSALVDEVLGGA